MWVFLSLLSAVGAAGTGITLKRALAGGSAVATTVAYRAIGGGLLLAVLVAVGAGWPLGEGYWGAVAVVIPFEVVGTVAFTMALRAGDVSLVQPLFGLLPVTVTLGAAVALGERPTAPALGGIVLVAAGVYALGRSGTRGLWAPLRALAADPSGRWAGLAIAAWTVTTVAHKVGIEASGPLPWAVTLALGSALALALAGPLLPTAAETEPRASTRRWAGWAAAAGALYAVQQVGLQLALAEAPAGYVVAIASVSILLAVVAGMVLLGERAARRARLVGGTLVTLGSVVVALWG